MFIMTENLIIFYILFLMFAFLNLMVLLLLIFSINPVFSISYLMLFFFINFAVLICLHIEFMAVTFLVIYAGAISILFIFVMLLFDIKFLLLYDRKTLNVNLLLFMLIIFFIVVFFLLYNFTIVKNSLVLYFIEADLNFYVNWVDMLYFKYEIENLGKIIYNYYYFHLFWLVFALFNAMIGIMTLSINKLNIMSKKNFFLTKDDFAKLFFMS